MARCVALVVAAGRGSRFGGEIPKQWRDLGGRPVLRHSLGAFAAHPGVAAVRGVIHPDDRAFYDAAAAGLALADPIAGGADPPGIGSSGPRGLGRRSQPDLVLIHDGARPFIDGGVISRVIAALEEHTGAIPALPVHDTLKRADAGRIGETVARAGLWRAQTPQGFHFADISGRPSGGRRAAN